MKIKQILLPLFCVMFTVMVSAQTNMNRWITLTVKINTPINFEALSSSQTSILAKSGDRESGFSIGPTSSGMKLFMVKGTEVKIYGDITTFKILNHTDRVIGLDASHNEILSVLQCGGNQIANLNVSGSSALTQLFCADNHITNLNLSNNPNLMQLECYNNRLDACSLDRIYGQLPMRNEGDSARIYIKHSSATNAYPNNPGAANSRHMLATQKNWKVLDRYTETQINNADYTCDAQDEDDEEVLVVNMESWIDLFVSDMATVKFRMKSTERISRIRIESDDLSRELNIGSAWSDTIDFTSSSANFIRIYGDINEFELVNNGPKVIGLDVSNNTDLKGLDCSGNRITVLEVSQNNRLEKLNCSRNNLDACALDSLYRSLIMQRGASLPKIYIKNSTQSDFENPGADQSQHAIATAKHWMVLDVQDDMPIANTSFECIEVVEDPLNLTHIQRKQTIKISPNPTKGIVTIRSQQPISKMSLYNIVGNLLFDQEGKNQDVSHINLSHLPAGIYFLRVETREGTRTYKIIRE